CRDRWRALSRGRGVDQHRRGRCARSEAVHGDRSRFAGALTPTHSKGHGIMRLLEFPVRRYQFTLVAFLCLIVMGWFAFASVPREEDPFFKIPAFFITTIYPGADPKDLERLVVKPIEDRLAELDDVKTIETSITDGLAFVTIEFLASADADKKYDEVTREVNALRPELPQDISSLEVRKISPGLVNIVQLALVSENA